MKFLTSVEIMKILHNNRSLLWTFLMILILMCQPQISLSLSQSSKSMISVSAMSPRHLKPPSKNLRPTSLAAIWTSLITLSLFSSNNPCLRLTTSLSLCRTLAVSTARQCNLSKTPCKLPCNIRCKCNWCNSNNLQQLQWWVAGWINSRLNNNNSFTIRISTCLMQTSSKPLATQWCSSSRLNSNQASSGIIRTLAHHQRISPL